MAKAPNTKGHGPGGNIKGMKSPGGKALTPPKAGINDLNSITRPRGSIVRGRNAFERNFN